MYSRLKMKLYCCPLRHYIYFILEVFNVNIWIQLFLKQPDILSWLPLFHVPYGRGLISWNSSQQQLHSFIVLRAVGGNLDMGYTYPGVFLLGTSRCPDKHKNQSEGTDGYWGINAKRCNSALAFSRKFGFTWKYLWKIYGETHEPISSCPSLCVFYNCLCHHSKNSLYLLFVCVLEWSLLGVKKGWATRKIGLLKFQNFRRVSPPLSYGRPPRGFSFFLWK